VEMYQVSQSLSFYEYLILCFRSTLMGFDLNRTWHQISRWAHPTLHAVHTMLTELDQNRVSVFERTIYQVINHIAKSTFHCVRDLK
jgi:hypothetical protein